MKTFNSLVFKKHVNYFHFSAQAIMNFKNGYGISVINGHGAYCSKDTYEVAVLYEGQLCYTTPITNHIIGHCTPSMVSDIMKQIQKLKP